MPRGAVKDKDETDLVLNWAALARFWSKVDKSGECWIWTGSLGSSMGYGDILVGGMHYRAHRVSYALQHGTIPAGLVIDHLCRRPACVRPEHLEAVSQRTNILRGESLFARNATKTTCPNGHPYDRIVQGRRGCRACKAAYMKTYERKH